MYPAKLHSFIPPIAAIDKNNRYSIIIIDIPITAYKYPSRLSDRLLDAAVSSTESDIAVNHITAIYGAADICMQSSDQVCTAINTAAPYINIAVEFRDPDGNR